VIAIHGLTKRYRDVLAVDDLSLEIPSGSVCGLLGRNGSGKTTTFKCALGFVKRDAGEVTFDGEPLSPRTFLTLGYVPETAALYDWLTVAQHLELARRSQASFDAAHARELAATFRLDGRRRAGRLSKGQQTALNLVLALAARPAFLILDEPGSGLDPVLQRAVLDLLIDAAGNGATILLSSHQIGQVERAADRVAIIRDGKLVVSGEIDDLKTGDKVVEAIFERAAPPPDGIASDPRVRRVERSGVMLRAYTARDAEAVATALIGMGARSVRIIDRGLEDIFLEAVGTEAVGALG
jgi:ABC-2 type transport system ATP-binding protein